MAIDRRRLIQATAIGSAAFILNACSKKSEPETPVSGEMGTAPAETEKKLELVSEEDGTAQALGYKHNAADVEASVKVEKMGVPGGEQNCANCAFYASLEGVEGGGKCQLIMGGYVKAAGWCKSWGKKQS